MQFVSLTHDRYFVTEKKPALVFEAVAQKIVESYKSCISIGNFVSIKFCLFLYCTFSNLVFNTILKPLNLSLNLRLKPKPIILSCEKVYRNCVACTELVRFILLEHLLVFKAWSMSYYRHLLYLTFLHS